jgi:hypothetical protein
LTHQCRKARPQRNHMLAVAMLGFH